MPSAPDNWYDEGDDTIAVDASQATQDEAGHVLADQMGVAAWSSTSGELRPSGTARSVPTASPAKTTRRPSEIGKWTVSGYESGPMTRTYRTGVL